MCLDCKSRLRLKSKILFREYAMELWLHCPYLILVTFGWVEDMYLHVYIAFLGIWKFQGITSCNVYSHFISIDLAIMHFRPQPHKILLHDPYNLPKVKLNLNDWYSSPWRLLTWPVQSPTIWHLSCVWGSEVCCEQCPIFSNHSAPSFSCLILMD